MAVFKEINEHYKAYINGMNTRMKEMNEVIAIHQKTETQLTGKFSSLKEDYG